MPIRQLRCKGGSRTLSNTSSVQQLENARESSVGPVSLTKIESQGNSYTCIILQSEVESPSRLSRLYDATWSPRRLGQGPHSDRTWRGRTVRPDKCPVPRNSDPHTSCTPFGRVAPPRAVVCALLSYHGRGRPRALHACVPESTAVRTAPARKRCGRPARPRQWSYQSPPSLSDRKQRAAGATPESRSPNASSTAPGGRAAKPPVCLPALRRGHRPLSRGVPSALPTRQRKNVGVTAPCTPSRCEL
jgi:hypothetical protein